MGEPSKARARVPGEMWETFRRCRFVHRTFRPYPCVVAIEPLSEEGGNLWKPYRGEPYDPSVFQMVEDGWDHEHCDVCNVTIADGDSYWANDGPEHVDLCLACYPLVQQELQT